jgi:hypothetical protein
MNQVRDLPHTMSSAIDTKTSFNLRKIILIVKKILSLRYALHQDTKINLIYSRLFQNLVYKRTRILDKIKNCNINNYNNN